MEINIQEILNKHEIPKVAHNKFKLAIKDVIIAVLQEAADSAKAIDNTYSMGGWGMKGGSVSVSKESITSTINKVKF